MKITTLETVIFKSYCFESESFKELTEILVIIENNLLSRHFQKLLVIFENYVFSKFTLTYIYKVPGFIGTKFDFVCESNFWNFE